MYEKCRLCGHRCGIDRRTGIGVCGMSDGLYVARAALHRWEEPPISGTRGSGTVFFSGCSLRCVYCQNGEISRGESGLPITVARLADIMLELQSRGAHNINLVTPTHYVPSIADAIDKARSKGMSLPIVYNTSSYDTVEALRMMEGRVDVYLSDLKYHLPETARRLSRAENYPEVARAAIAEMHRQVGDAVLDGEGIMMRGVIARVLLLPRHVAEAKLCVRYLLDTYGDGIYVSLMSQYTPPDGMEPPLDRRVTAEEYRELVEYAERIGLKNGFVQERGSAAESFIPPFDNSGVMPHI